MEKFLKYFSEEEGKKVFVYQDKGFVTYNICGKEFFIHDLYICPEFRNGEATKKLDVCIGDMARKEGCTYITANVFLKETNKKNFLRKLMRFNVLGYKPHQINGDAVTILKEL